MARKSVKGNQGIFKRQGRRSRKEYRNKRKHSEIKTETEVKRLTMEEYNTYVTNK